MVKNSNNKKIQDKDENQSVQKQDIENVKKHILGSKDDDWSEDKRRRYEAHTKLIESEVYRQQNDEALKNKAFHTSHWILVGLLFFLCCLMLLQGFKPLGFHLDNYILGVFIASVVVETIHIKNTIIRNLFPDSIVDTKSKKDKWWQRDIRSFIGK